MNKVKILLGPPGTGKTTKLLSLLEEEIAKGIPLNRIGFVSFTTKAANEAKERAAVKFNLPPEKFQYFKTIHALAFNWLNLSTANVMARKNYKELFDSLDIEYRGKAIDEDDTNTNTGASMGDKILFIQNLSSAKMTTLRDEWEESDFNEEVHWQELERFSRALAAYKESYGLVDFNDMLHWFLEKESVPYFDVLFIDEAQDLSRLQWACIDKIIAACPKVFIAGDDDQAIFRWAGADVDRFIQLQGEATVLNHSYRLRKNIHQMCTSILDQVQHRREKEFNPRDLGGVVEFVNDVEDIDMSEGNWLLLARNTYLLGYYENLCLANGYSYTGRNSPLVSDELAAVRAWEHYRKTGEMSDEDLKLIKKYSRNPPTDREVIWHKQLSKMNYQLMEYFIAALRRGETLTKTPRIRISTIHGAKGAEAENVVIMSDMSNKCYESLVNKGDDELRVAYVAVSRTRENLYIIQPRTSNFFDYSSL